MEQDNYVYPGKRFTENGFCTGHGQGMTLRDWFAGLAMQGLLAAQIHGFNNRPANGPFASMAYEMADAMLEARNTNAD